MLALLREMVRELEQHGQTGEPLVGVPGEGKRVEGGTEEHCDCCSSEMEE